MILPQKAVSTQGEVVLVVVVVDPELSRGMVVFRISRIIFRILDLGEFHVNGAWGKPKIGSLYFGFYSSFVIKEAASPRAGGFGKGRMVRLRSPQGNPSPLRVLPLLRENSDKYVVS